MPTITVKEFNKLSKMMGLTMSDQDGEALNAIRLANKVLKDNKLTWDDVFKRLITVDVEEVESEPETVQPSAQAQSNEINRAFDTVMGTADMTSDFGSFIQSLHDQWTGKGWLSVAQREALFNAVKRAKNREGARGRR